jgi:hypothetical protein
LLSTIFRASAKASAEVESGTVAARSVLVINRDDETGLPGEIETMEIVSLGLEDHGFAPKTP